MLIMDESLTDCGEEETNDEDMLASPLPYKYLKA
jgi:hypothetical protein